ncbi:MAG: 50S ribosomal protein L3 N(5)-glutamine methyltransferase [Gammaproteobacteria bacterium]|nr:MAG: 50S ribosomal protein L3 N(5)-glutamine methyltransferase [Gammaproteobacteria bacterium]
MNAVVRENATIEDAIRTVAKALRTGDLYYGHGTDNAIDEAAWLVLVAAELSPVLEPNYRARLSPEAAERCNRLLEKRVRERKPLAYLTGSAWFAGHRFMSDERALVPRSPLAEFIVNDFFGVLDRDPLRILDLCTGGGCIAIACAYQRMDAEVVGSDLSPDALELAAENVALHGMLDRVSLVESDLFASIQGRFDLIISNPPYVDALDLAAMPAEFRHEPTLGLASGVDGLDITRRILAEAANHLTVNGVLVVEVGNSAEALEQAMPELPFQWLTFEAGGGGVFLLHRKDLNAR